MNQLIFDRWTLNFHNVSHEILYENEQNETRLFTFRVLTGCLSIVGFACLITFVAQLQTGILVYEMAFMLTFNSLLLIFSKRLVPYLKYVFTIMFILFVVTSNLINSTGEFVQDFKYLRPHYVYGYSTCLLLMCTVQQSIYKLRILFVISIPVMQLGIYDVYDINLMQYVFFTLTGTILAALLTYNIEYTQRQAFSFGFIVTKYKEMIDQITSDALFALTFNERSNQLELKFQNKKFEELFHIFDKDQMKEFLRNVFIIPKSEEWRFEDQFKKHPLKSLEEYLFFKLKHTEGHINKDFKENSVQIGQMNKNELKKFQFQIKKFDLGQPIIIGQIQSNKVPELIERQEEQLKSFNNAVVNLTSQIAEQQQELFQQIKTIPCDCVKQYKIKQIQCSNFTIINLIKNILVFFQQEKIAYLKQNIECCSLTKIIEIIKPYLECRAHYFQRQFQLSQSIYSLLELKINTRILIQIMINIFEQILKISTQHSKITLNIYLEKTLNPNPQRFTSSVDLQQHVDMVQSQQFNSQRLIKFSFQFCSSAQVTLEPTIEMIDHKNWSNLNDLNTQINYPVTCILLGLIGPYNNIRTKQVALNNSQYLNTINFYFYADQSELDQSFIKFIKQSQRFQV